MLKTSILYRLVFFLAFFLLLTNASFAVNVIRENGFYKVKINVSSAKILPYVSNSLETIEEIALKTGADIVINTGYFDAKNKKTVSFITNNGEILANPKQNENLFSNTSLQEYLADIYNRSELRILNCEGKQKVDIAQHFEKVPENCKILNSTQAGPMIYPVLNLEKEAFIKIENDRILRDSIGANRPCARSFAGIKNNYLYLMITDENTTLTLYELYEKIKFYNFEKVINFDGGGSVAMFVKNKKNIFYQFREKNNQARPIKSALLVFW